MEFVSEMSEVQHSNSFKWKINVWNTKKVLYETEDVFKYKIKSENMYFQEVNANWTLEITEIPCFEFNSYCTDTNRRYFQADFKVTPSSDSFNEIFSFELRVKNVSHFENGNIFHPLQDRIKFKFPSDETRIELEAFCRVRKMVTNTRKVYEDEDNAYKRNFDYLDDDSVSRRFTPVRRNNEVPFPNLSAIEAAKKKYAETYEKFLAKQTLERSFGQQIIVSEQYKKYLEEAKQLQSAEQFVYVTDPEEVEPEDERSINSYLNQSLYEDAQSEHESTDNSSEDSTENSSENSSFEKIEESSHEVIIPQSSPSSASSKSKSEADTDYAILDLIPDEEQSMTRLEKVRTLKEAIERLLINSPKPENPLSMPFLNKRNSSMGETSSTVKNRINKILDFPDQEDVADNEKIEEMEDEEEENQSEVEEEDEEEIQSEMEEEEEIQSVVTSAEVHESNFGTKSDEDRILAMIRKDGFTQIIAEREEILEDSNGGSCPCGCTERKTEVEAQVDVGAVNSSEKDNGDESDAFDLKSSAQDEAQSVFHIIEKNYLESEEYVFTESKFRSPAVDETESNLAELEAQPNEDEEEGCTCMGCRLARITAKNVDDEAADSIAEEKEVEVVVENAVEDEDQDEESMGSYLAAAGTIVYEAYGRSPVEKVVEIVAEETEEVLPMAVSEDMESLEEVPLASPTLRVYSIKGAHRILTSGKMSKEAKEINLMKRISELHFTAMKIEAENQANLFILAAKMNFLPLVSDCSQQLLKIIERENFLDVWDIAVELNIEQLQEGVVDFIVAEELKHHISEILPEMLDEKVQKKINEHSN